MTADEREIRLRLPNVGVEIVGVRDVEKRAEIIMKCRPVDDYYSNENNVLDVDEVNERDDYGRCPYCGHRVDYIETRRTAIRYEHLFENGECADSGWSGGDDIDYYCPHCGESLSEDDLENMGVRL